jgi:hypothetical protein
LGAAIFYAVDAVALLRAVLAEHCPSDEAAAQHLAECERLGIDPLDHCAHHFGLGNMQVWARAARWAGYAFVSALPKRGSELPINRLDRLAEVRSIRTSIDGEECTAIAPRFDHVIALRQRPSLEHVRFAAPDTIERALADAASAQLMDDARQRISLLWPRASAADLPRHVRIAFAVLVTVTIVIAMLAGAILRPFLIPIVAAVLMAPGMLRLAAAIPARAVPEPRPLSDHELPVYSVLIPLRDEAQMVPLLRQAMMRLDYPSHLLDIKFVVEAKSPETVHAVEQAIDDPRFRIIEVPPGPPHTKPKALDYALPLARGEFVVVYDAEDVPDADQLRRAAARFRADPALACLQAELGAARDRWLGRVQCHRGRRPRGKARAPRSSRRGIHEPDA